MRGPWRWLGAGAAGALLLAARPAAAQTSDPGEADATEGLEGDAGTPPAPAAPPPPSAAPPAAAAPAPPAGYYTEPPRGGGDPTAQPVVQAAPPPPGLYEPPPPGMGAIYEPPPPPEPTHVAPKNALWLGVRGGVWVPFGSAWGRCTAYYTDGACAEYASIAMNDFVSSGPLVELDLGARVARAYNVYVAWERAALGGGDAELAVTLDDDSTVLMPPSQKASTNFYGLGVRFSSDADKVGFLADLLIGYRDLRVEWDRDAVPTGGVVSLTMDQAPLEFRFGLGADIRVHELFTLSPLVTIGSGRFGNLEWEFDDGSTQDAMSSTDVFAAHGWFSLQLGAHFDLFGK